MLMRANIVSCKIERRKHDGGYHEYPGPKFSSMLILQSYCWDTIWQIVSQVESSMMASAF